jgi:hypothetical protein
MKSIQLTFSTATTDDLISAVAASFGESMETVRFYSVE